RTLPLVRPSRQLDVAERPGDARQCLRGLARRLGAGLVVVLEDQRIAAGERLDAVLRPIATRDRGGAVPEFGDTIRVFFALGHEYGGVRVLQQLRPPIEHATDVT